MGVVILPKAGVEAFLKSYETYSDNVVHRSAKCFSNLSEEDGTQVWRIVLFKTAVDAFMKKAREERVATCRAFTYDAAAYEAYRAEQEKTNESCEKQEKIMKSFCKSAISDVMVAWVHVKAMRVFVESVL